MDMYDEVIEVRGGREVDSPPDLDVESALEFVNGENPEFSDEEMSNNVNEQELGATSMQARSFKKVAERESSPESMSSPSRNEEKTARVDLDFDPKIYENVDASPEIKGLMQYISRYTPQRIPIEYKLKIFIPEYIPAVGDIDAFLKITPPEPISSTLDLSNFIKTLGLEVVDEPCGEQSDEVLLQMKIRSIFPKSVDETPTAIAKAPKDIDRWIQEIQALHVNQPDQSVLHHRSVPNIDNLMAEWPTEMEKLLDSCGFPSPDLDCSLLEYIRIAAGLFDVPLPNPEQHNDYLIAVYTLMSLYAAIRENKKDF